VGKGTGLGLSLSYGIVEKHHGRIEVQSTPGQGTTFRISLPVAQTPPVSPDGGA
jgi:signal transduction histidine kinase